MGIFKNILKVDGSNLQGLGENKKSYYIRFTDDVKRDIDIGKSYHITDFDKTDFKNIEDGFLAPFDDDGNRLIYSPFFKRWVYEQKGLDAFELEDAENAKDAIKLGKKFYYNSVYNTQDMPDFAIVEGEYVGNCPKGDQIKIKKILFESYK